MIPNAMVYFGGHEESYLKIAGCDGDRQVRLFDCYWMWVEETMMYKEYGHRHANCSKSRVSVRPRDEQCRQSWKTRE